MRTLETERLVIRPFVTGDAAEFKRLLDEAFGSDICRSAASHAGGRSLLGALSRAPGARLRDGGGSRDPRAEPDWFQTVGVLVNPAR